MRQRDKLLERARDVFHPASGTSVLEVIAWPREVEERFFASGESEVPVVEYAVDKGEIHGRLAELDAFERELVGDDALTRLLRSCTESYRLSSRMALAAGTHAFYPLSREAYGGARTTALDDDTTNLDFADHLAARLGDGPTGGTEGRGMNAEEFADDLRARLAKRHSGLEVDLRITSDVSAKAIAGVKRLKVRADATFEPEEARSLFLHEVETHLLSAQNGGLQPHMPFLKSGGPKTTRTQEGLAVFAEFFSQALTRGRMRRLVERVRLVGMAEDGASFVELYRYLRERGLDRHAAFLDTSRVCRGGVPSGGAPFTKDASYLSGFMEVYNFLRLAVRGGSRDVAEVLVSGRLALEDVETLVELRRDGLLEPPTHRPTWLRHWDDVVTHFAFTSFLAEIDLGFVERKYPWLRNRASARPPHAHARD